MNVNNHPAVTSLSLDSPSAGSGTGAGGTELGGSGTGAVSPMSVSISGRAASAATTTPVAVSHAPQAEPYHHTSTDNHLPAANRSKGNNTSISSRSSKKGRIRMVAGRGVAELA